MVKKRGLLVIFMFVFVFLVLNLFLYLNKSGVSYNSISGLYLQEFSDLPLGLNMSLIIFILQWIILLAISFFGIVSYFSNKSLESTKVSYKDIRSSSIKAITPLDSFYNLLREKKALNIPTLAKVFGIPKERALEWAKILENSELVRIEYPAFSSPEVRLNEKQVKEKTEEEPKAKKEEFEEGGASKEKASEKEEGWPVPRKVSKESKKKQHAKAPRKIKKVKRKK